MNNLNGPLNLTIAVAEYNIEQQDYAVRQLYREIRDLDIGTIGVLSDYQQINEGTKSVDPATLNALMLSVTPIAITKILEFLHSWVTRKEGRTVKIKIQKANGSIIEVEIPSSMPSKELRQLIKTVETSVSSHKG